MSLVADEMYKIKMRGDVDMNDTVEFSHTYSFTPGKRQDKITNK